VAEELKRLDFRDPQTMQLQYSIATPKCGGINHADFAIDGSFALFTCEFDGAVTKIDLVNRKVIGTITLSPYYARPDVVAQLTALEKKKSELISTQQVIVQEAPELGGAICTSRGMPQDIRARPTARPSSWPTCWPMVCMSWTARRSSRSASSRPGSARMASIPAATANRSTSPTAAPTR
jgi:hypothetical protein